MVKYTYNYIKKSLPSKKNGRSSFWTRIIVRPLSFPFTYLFINSGWTANKVSILSWYVIFVASLLMCFNNFWLILSGIILVFFWHVLDCVDGNIARCKKKKTYMGDFYDAIAGYGPYSFTTIGLSVAAYNTTNLIPNEFRWLILVIGGFAAMINLYTRLIHQKYLACFFAAKSILNETEDINLKDTENKHSFAYIREFIDKNLGVTGIFVPWLMICLFTKTFEFMLAFYAIYYTVAFLAIAFIYCRKAEIFEIECQLKKTLFSKNNTL